MTDDIIKTELDLDAEDRKKYDELVSAFIRRGFIMAGYYPEGALIDVAVPWAPIRPLLPRKTVSKKWIWFTKGYTRTVMRSTGGWEKKQIEYGTLFDVLMSADK